MAAKAEHNLYNLSKVMIIINMTWAVAIMQLLRGVIFKLKLYCNRKP